MFPFTEWDEEIGLRSVDLTRLNTGLDFLSLYYVFNTMYKLGQSESWKSVYSMRFGFVILSCFLMISCRSETNHEFPGTSNETLNTLLHASPYSFIDLESVVVDTALIQEEHILGRTTTIDSTAMIGRTVGFVKVDDHLYVADGQQNTIWQMDLDGNLIHRIGAEGRGPGEFESLSGIVSNSSYIYTFDQVMRSVSIFDRQFNFITSFIHGGGATPLSTGSAAANDGRLLLPLSLVAPPDTERYLLQSYHTNPPFEEQRVFLSPLVSGAGIMNNFYVTSNHNSGDLAIVFRKLNYLFLFDEHLNQIHSLVFNTPHHTFPDQIVESEPMSVPNFFISVYLSDDDEIYVSTVEGSRGDSQRHVLYRIVKGDDGYQLNRAFHFRHENSDLGRVELPVVEMMVADDTLYFTVPLGHYVYRYPF